jgi:hypothetical protein
VRKGVKRGAPGESLEFLAHIRGWQTEARKQRHHQLLQMNDIGLRAVLTSAAGTDVFFIPEVHFAGETPVQEDEGWWYQVRSVIWFRECRKCRVRKEQAEFMPNEWCKKGPAICTWYATGRPGRKNDVRKYVRQGGWTEQARCSLPGEATTSSPWARTYHQGGNVRV